MDHPLGQQQPAGSRSSTEIRFTFLQEVSTTSGSSAVGGTSWTPPRIQAAVFAESLKEV